MRPPRGVSSTPRENPPAEVCAKLRPAPSDRFARQRAYRARSRRGERVLKPTVDFYAFVDTLIAAGWLSAAEALDARKVDAAASEVGAVDSGVATQVMRYA